MAKSLRSKWRRKMKAKKRARVEPRIVARLKELVSTPHIPTVVEIEAKAKEAVLRAKLTEETDEMEATKGEQTTSEQPKIRPWMNQRRLKRMSNAQKIKAASAVAKLVSSDPKHAPRIKVNMKKRMKGRQYKLNRKALKLSKFPVSR